MKPSGDVVVAISTKINTQRHLFMKAANWSRRYMWKPGAVGAVIQSKSFLLTEFLL